MWHKSPSQFRPTTPGELRWKEWQINPNESPSQFKPTTPGELRWKEWQINPNKSPSHGRLPTPGELKWIESPPVNRTRCPRRVKQMELMISTIEAEACPPLMAQGGGT